MHTACILPEFNIINRRDTTYFDSEDDYRTDCRNVSHCQQQQSYSGLRSPGRSNSTYFQHVYVAVNFLSRVISIFPLFQIR